MRNGSRQLRRVAVEWRSEWIAAHCVLLGKIRRYRTGKRSREQRPRIFDERKSRNSRGIDNAKSAGNGRRGRLNCLRRLKIRGQRSRNRCESIFIGRSFPARLRGNICNCRAGIGRSKNRSRIPQKRKLRRSRGHKAAARNGWNYRSRRTRIWSNAPLRGGDITSRLRLRDTRQHARCRRRSGAGTAA